MFDKLKRKIHNLRPSVREERIRLKAKQEIFAIISNELGLDADGDTFVGASNLGQYAMFYVDELNGIFKVIRKYQVKPNTGTVNEDDKSRKIENYESM